MGCSAAAMHANMILAVSLMLPLCRLTSMITQLIRHPTVLQRLKQEQQQVLAKHGSEISSELHPHAARA